MGKKLGSIFLIVMVVFFAISGYRYVKYRQDNAVSDAAFIKSKNLPIIAFKVPGKVVKMNFKEFDIVKKGDILAVIDSSDFLLSKKALEHNINSLQNKIDALILQKNRVYNMLNLQKNISVTSASQVSKEVSANRLKIKAKLSEYNKVEKDRKRYAKLLKQNVIAKGDYEKISTKATALKNEIDALKQSVNAVALNKNKANTNTKITQEKIKQVNELKKSIESLVEQKKAMLAQLEQAIKQVEYTKIYSPFNAIVAKKFFDAPRVASAGAPVYALVDTKAIYCEVLLSEKKLNGVKVGNSVKVTIDALKKDYKGKVASIAPTSASTFSLVPRDIASGEFTKLDQRFVVKIELENLKNLRVGMGATVAIERVED